MTNVKKTLSVLLALVLVLGTCMFSAFAAGADAATLKVVPDKATANVGDVITVSVKLDANYAVASSSAVVQFDTADFELVEGSVKPNKAFFGTELATGAAVFNPKAGVVGVSFIAKKTAKYETKTDVELFNFQLKALKANANAALTLPKEELKSEAKPDGKIFCGKGDSSENIQITPCVIELTNAAVNIGGGAPAAEAELALAPTANPGVRIDSLTFNGAYTGVVYGFEQVKATTFRNDAYLVESFVATNNGSLKITPSKGKACGTGTTIEVLNSDGTSTNKIYVVVIFGDVNGDGVFNVNDTKATKAAAKNASLAPASSPTRMAANAQFVNNAVAMHTLNATDTKFVKGNAGKQKLDQAKYAELHHDQSLLTGNKQSKYI